MAGSTAAWDKIRETIAQLGRAEVRVGVVGAQAQEQHGETGETNAEIALWMEYGTSRLPERSFIRKTLRDRGIGLLGAWMASQIQKTILDDKVDPELAPSTVEAKRRAGLGGPGGDKVLVATGQLAAAVGWGIVK